eukprot:3314903-Pyramimonas_sp.AAC.2
MGFTNLEAGLEVLLRDSWADLSMVGPQYSRLLLTRFGFRVLQAEGVKTLRSFDHHGGMTCEIIVGFADAPLETGIPEFEQVDENIDDDNHTKTPTSSIVTPTNRS